MKFLKIKNEFVKLRDINKFSITSTRSSFKDQKTFSEVTFQFQIIIKLDNGEELLFTSVNFPKYLDQRNPKDDKWENQTRDKIEKEFIDFLGNKEIILDPQELFTLTLE